MSLGKLLGGLLKVHLSPMAEVLRLRWAQDQLGERCRWPLDFHPSLSYHSQDYRAVHHLVG